MLQGDYGNIVLELKMMSEKGAEHEDRNWKGGYEHWQQPAPHAGCELEEKGHIWSELDEMSILRSGVEVGGDFNGHVGEGNR